MLMFCGFDLELAVEAVLVRDRGPALCQARDPSGNPWLIAQADHDPAHLAWLCAPLSERAIQAVACGEALATDAIRHSATGTVVLVVVDHGRAVPDQCLPGVDVAENLLARLARPTVAATSIRANPVLAPSLEVSSAGNWVAD
jgi:hypothetical protein